MSGTVRRRLLGPVLHRLGLEVTGLDDRAWLVQRRPAGLRPRGIGPAELRSHLVVDDEAIRRVPNRFQLAVSNHLADEHLRWVLRALRINCVLDVGANVGQFGTRLRATGYTGRLVSFEPVPDLAAQLREAAAGDPEWQVHQTATGDADGVAEINVVPGTMSSLLTASEFGRAWSSRLRESHTEEIEVRRLDGMIDEATAGLDEPRIFLKMDTQGYDLPTLAGVGDRLEQVLGLQSEVACVPIYDGMPRFTEQLATYEDHGFEISALFPVTRDRTSLRVIEFDAVMVRTGAQD